MTPRERPPRSLLTEALSIVGDIPSGIRDVLGKAFRNIRTLYVCRRVYRDPLWREIFANCYGTTPGPLLVSWWEGYLTVLCYVKIEESVEAFHEAGRDEAFVRQAFELGFREWPMVMHDWVEAGAVAGSNGQR